MRKLVFNLHLYGALIAGLFVVVIGVTGSILAFEPELDKLMNPSLFRVQPQSQRLSVAALFQAASQAYPGQRIPNMRLAQSPDESVQFPVKGRQVFLNPYSGEILGERGVTTLGMIHQVHLRLLMGETGSWIVTIATCVLLFLVISGIYLWWPWKRITIKWGASARRVHFDAHNAVGICSALFLLVLGATGVAIHFDNSLEQYLHQRAGTRKIGRNAPSTPTAGVRPIDADQAVKIALEALPGAQALLIVPPAGPKASYLIAMHFPEDLTPGGRSWVTIDQYSGKVLIEQNSRTVAMGTRAIIWNRAIHTGDVYGLPTKTLLSLASLMLALQAITGYYLWWKKLRARQRQIELDAEASLA